MHYIDVAVALFQRHLPQSAVLHTCLQNVWTTLIAHSLFLIGRRPNFFSLGLIKLSEYADASALFRRWINAICLIRDMKFLYRG